MEIIEAKREHIDSIAKLCCKLADFHRKIDKYYKRGNKRTFKEQKKYLLKNYRKKDRKILVALEDKKVIGCSIAGIKTLEPHAIKSPKKIGKIGGTFVLKEYRRKGVGKQMLKELLKWFKAKKIKHIELSVDARNKIGIKAWKKFGFFEFQKKMRLDL
jgi:ribosomal protein S18 acetylase RimI-like enzyme